MLQRTAAIVLRTVKYGETSVVATLFTEKFGLQSYLVNGVRAAKSKSNKAPMFQPGAQLWLEAYHQPLKNLQRIKECEWKEVYRHIFSDVIKNSVTLFITEMLQRCLKQPEENEPLFAFSSDALLHLDSASTAATANYPLFFSLNLLHFFGFGLSSATTDISEVQNENFQKGNTTQLLSIDEKNSVLVNELLSVRMPEELAEFRISSATRNHLLDKILEYYRLHIPEFGNLRTLPVLRQILS